MPGMARHLSCKVPSLPLSVFASSAVLVFTFAGPSFCWPAIERGTIGSGWSQHSLWKVTVSGPPGMGGPSRYPSPRWAN